MCVSFDAESVDKSPRDNNSDGVTAAHAPTPALSISSSSSISTLSSPVVDHQEREDQEQIPPDFVNRVYHLPIVHSAFRAYEQGKASSRVVKVSLDNLFPLRYNIK